MLQCGEGSTRGGAPARHLGETQNTSTAHHSLLTGKVLAARSPGSLSQCHQKNGEGGEAEPWDSGAWDGQLESGGYHGCS